jgi:hypothetical protein
MVMALKKFGRDARNAVPWYASWPNFPHFCIAGRGTDVWLEDIVLSGYRSTSLPRQRILGLLWQSWLQSTYINQFQQSKTSSAGLSLRPRERLSYPLPPCLPSCQVFGQVPWPLGDADASYNWAPPEFSPPVFPRSHASSPATPCLKEPELIPASGIGFEILTDASPRHSKMMTPTG